MCAVVSQYDSLPSHAVDDAAATDEVPTAAVVAGSSSCCYDNGAVGGVGVSLAAMHSSVTSSDLWCHAGHLDMAGRKMVDTWLPSDDSEDLAELFSRLGLGKYTDIFQQQEVNMISS